MNYTMNYEKLYKSVLVKIQEALASTKDGHKISGLTRDCLENIFPELKENENERIRKVLIDYFQAYKEKKERGITTFNGIPTDNILAWLEKQSEQKPQGKTALEAVKEEKIDNQNCVNPADKVEPKFHEGEWLQYRNAKPFFVEEITKQGYVNGISCLPFDWEDEIHLWSIDDAKRGDVLVDAYGNIGIFDKCYDLDWMSCCSLGNNGGFQYFTVEHENEKTHPATKEQRELLFQKMKDARWEWDSVNKDLKRITKFKIGDKVHCGDETQPVTIIGITNDSYTTDSMIGPIPFSEEDNWTLIKHKFNVDDWIVFNGFILHIDEVVNGYYRTTSISYAIHNSYDWDIDNVARLWNISDAKCGDVLISSPHKQPFVYNGNHTRDDIGAYFGLNYQGELLICDSHGNNWTELTGVQPATEEQCNTLFKKLHDSDYKWDGEKKELWHKYL